MAARLPWDFLRPARITCHTTTTFKFFSAYNLLQIQRGDCTVKQTVYVDVLVSVNIIVDYFLLYSSALIAGRKKERIRLCLAALFGGASSLLIFLPTIPSAINILFAVGISALMTLIAFGFVSKSAFFRTLIVLYALSSAYSGLMLLLWSIGSARNLSVNNGIVYINLDPALLILSTVIIYAVMSLCSCRLRSRNLHRAACTVSIFGNGSRVDMDGLIDTGNVLTEPFSGLPVIIADRSRLSRILPDFVLHAADGNFNTASPPHNIRIIPFQSAGGSGVYIAYRPERTDIDICGKTAANIKAYIALADNGCSTAIVNPDAVNH